MTQLDRLRREAVRRIEIRTPDHQLNDPAVRGQLYGLLVMVGILQRATHTLPQLTRHAYPGQPSTRTHPPTKRCTCRYIRWYAEFVITTMPVATGFQLNPACPHHGHLDELTIERLWSDPNLNVLRDPYDMDDDERSSL